ncbi:MAG: hypothetical protein ACI4S0_10005 [Dorea sp.]
MKRKVIIIILAALCILFFEIVASGFTINTNAYITDDFVVSEDGSKIIFKVGDGIELNKLV